MQTKTITSVLLPQWILLFGLALLTMPVSGQIENHLILKKHGFHDKMNFLPGDQITFIRAGNNYQEEYVLEGIGVDFILVSGEVVPIKDIAKVVRYRTGFNFKGSGKALLIAAPSYLVIGFVNELFHQRNNGFKGSDLVPTTTNLIVAGSFLTAGLILPSLQVRKYPIGKKFTLKVAQTDPAFNKLK